MRLILDGEDRIRLDMAGEGFEILSDGTPVSPFHLLAGSLASCTALTVSTWAEGAGIDTGPLVVSVSWEVAGQRPMRVTRMVMDLRWPGLPAERVATAERVAELCPIHATLRRAAEISRRVTPAG